MRSFSVAAISASYILSLARGFVLQQSASSCSKLNSFYDKSLGITIYNATLIPRGGLNVSNVFNSVSFCQIVASVAYANSDTLNFQLWLPEETIYEGRFMAVGGGGMAGTVDTSNMIQQLNKGFAVAGGDSGHRAADNNNGGGAPGVYLPYLHDVNQVKAWIHNAISILTQPAKSLVEQYYGAPARYSYYDGCSTGGAQGFALAQFYPDLFDGIYAGSPGNWYSHLALSFLWNGLKTQNTSYLNQDLLNYITDAVLDGGDRLIENPLLCNFDMNKLACDTSTTDTSTCLTPSQLTAAKAIYAGPTSSINGAQLYPGFSFGSETEWALQEQTLSNAFSIPILQNLVYNNLNYDYNTFNFGSDVKDVDLKAGVLIDEITTDLTAFKKAGGKMLVTQGWADPYNAAIWPIQHMQDIQNFFKGSDISDFFNLFMVPGGGHCGAASNYPNVPATYHVVDRLIHTVKSRKLCPWPQTASFVPGGDENSWADYVYYCNDATQEETLGIPKGWEDGEGDVWALDTTKAWPQWNNQRTGRARLNDPYPPPPRTYLDDRLLKAHLSLVQKTPDSPEHLYHRVLNSLLHILFTSKSGYWVIRESLTPSFRSRFIVLQLFPLLDDDGVFHEHMFLLTECRRLGEPWELVEQHLENVCRNNDGHTKNFFAMIQIGLQVRFYRYENRTFEKISDVLDLVGDAMAVMERANYIKTHPVPVV
ncbi:hypothetical protein B7463_g1032, partial [Scytalidium lignicola]